MLTREEAEAKAAQENQTRMLIFCPLSAGSEYNTCKTCCECYVWAEAVRDKDLKVSEKRSYRVKGGYCTCYSLKGLSVKSTLFQSLKGDN